MTAYDNKGFSLMEIMVVLFIISIVVAFGLPKYSKALDKTNEKNARMQLLALQAANFNYLSQYNEFLPGTALNINQINNGLEMNLIANGFTYSYTQSASDAFTATADWQGEYTVLVDETPAGVNNPCCSAGSCPTLTNCL